MADKKSGQIDTTIADMYERWTLDCVVEIAHALSIDFVGRPQQYKDVPEPIVNILQDIWYRTNMNPGFPGTAKRGAIFMPLIGPSDGNDHDRTSQFHTSSAALRERARAFTERQVETGEDNLRRAFQDAAITSRSYLVTLSNNAVVTIGNSQTGNTFERATEVLTNSEIAAVFGRKPSTEANWPIGGTFDENGARVIEEITRTLETKTGLVLHSDFIVMQRIATFGANALRKVLRDSGISAGKTSDLDTLIQESYRWKTALDAQGTIVPAG